MCSSCEWSLNPSPPTMLCKCFPSSSNRLVSSKCSLWPPWPVPSSFPCNLPRSSEQVRFQHDALNMDFRTAACLTILVPVKVFFGKLGSLAGCLPDKCTRFLGFLSIFIFRTLHGLIPKNFRPVCTWDGVANLSLLSLVCCYLREPREPGVLFFCFSI